MKQIIKLFIIAIFAEPFIKAFFPNTGDIIFVLFVAGEIIYYFVQKEKEETKDTTYSRHIENTGKVRDEYLPKNTKIKRYPSGWTFNEKTGLWEPPAHLRSSPKNQMTGEGTYRYDYIHTPFDQQQHFHHTDTDIVVKREVVVPKQKTEEEKPEPIKPTHQEPIHQETARPLYQETIRTTYRSGPRVIYTYLKPELRPEDREDDQELDFENSYQRKELFTTNEWQNYKKLRRIAEERGYVICPKVRLFDLLEPRHNKKWKKTYQYKIQAKHVDFVICDQSMNVLAVLELDDNSHYDPEVIKKDEFVNRILVSVGYTVIRTKYIDYDIFDIL